MPLRKVVFVRHGESQGNAENVYTGWGDTPLSLRGEQEAVEAGLCIKTTGAKFDTVFTSFLDRAIKTTELVCNSSGHESVPVVKHWRLNARHSGGLQGLTQPQAVALYGEKNVGLWRSSYDILPACVDEKDPRHPFNDPRYEHVPREQLPPGGESLKHTVERVVPYWTDEIVPKIQAGESVLVIAHKNSFRALWKCIENTADEDALDAKMNPASAPLVYEFEDQGRGSDLKFIKKYIMQPPFINPALPPGTKAMGKAYFLRSTCESVSGTGRAAIGWEDTALTLKGEQQAVDAGLVLKEKGVTIDMIFTSVLQRAVKTAKLACMTSDNAFGVPVVKSWCLNPRHSGVLQGLTDAEAETLFGQTATKFRTSPDSPPACLDRKDPRHPAHHSLYADVPPEDLPGGESFDEMAKRVLSFWKSDVMPHIVRGKSVLVVAHRTPLKAILEYFSATTEQWMCYTEAHSTLPLVVEFAVGDAILTTYSLSSFAPQLSPTLKTVGKVVFVRHGESSCNLTEAISGWEDCGLTPKGEKQCAEAGLKLLDRGYKFSVVFTSVLSRATESVEKICKESGNSSVPVVKSWRLNARHPGVLQGLKKSEAIEKFGKDNFNLWRGSYDVMPQCVDLSDPRHPAQDPLYAGVPPEELPPGGESLKRVMDRIVQFWVDQVTPRVRAGETILIVGHLNSLKALFMYLEDTSEHEMFDVQQVSATAPRVFEFGDSGLSTRLAVMKKYTVKHSNTKEDVDLGLDRQVISGDYEKPAHNSGY